MNSNDIISLLANKHSEDVFVPECNIDSAFFASGQRMDAWGFKKSWSHPLTFGYEIKVSRSDFLQDNKWRPYLDYCNQFSFVCPHSLISPDELPEDTGLIWVSKTGTKLFTKKKAPYREVTIPESIYRAVLMSRSVITSPNWGKSVKDNVLYWNNWLLEKEKNNDLGHRVSYKIREIVDTVRIENNKLKDENEIYSEIKELVDKLGINKRWIDAHSVEQQIKNLEKLLPKNFEHDLECLQGQITCLLNKIKVV